MLKYSIVSLVVSFSLLFCVQVFAKVCTQEEVEQHYLNSAGSIKNMSDSSFRNMTLVFDCNKADILSIYSNKLKDNPDTQGIVVITFEWLPDGTVDNVTTMSSDITDKEFLEKLRVLVKSFKFPKTDISKIYKYPISFVPE